jgi:hypothetical protein
MARWHDEDRWGGERERYGEGERRWPGERGEEGWRGRDWRDDDRRGEWRGSERPGERWERDRWTQGGEWRGRERSEWDRDRGGFYRPEWRESGRGYEGQGRHHERSVSGAGWPGESVGWGEPRGASFGAGGMYGGPGGEYGGGPALGARYGMGHLGAHEPFGGRGEHTTWGSRSGGRTWGGEEADRRWGRSMRSRLGEEEEGPLARMGERIREGFRRLTGRGPKGYRRSDERIRDDVSERIARSGVDAEEVEVKAEGAEVTLTGFVRSREEKRILEDLADDVFGVEEVNNHLRIRRETRGATEGAESGAERGGQAIGTQGSHSQPARH